MVSVLSEELFGKQLSLHEFPTRRDLKGLGMSDWGGYASALAKRFSYTNTFLERAPRLDITQPPDRTGELDFVVASDVFEHVAPPVEKALRHVGEMLNPGGFLLLTVPYTLGVRTKEHFPELFDYEILNFKGNPVLVNRTASGRLEVFDDLVFHGGEGLTLEMRMFCRDGLFRSLAEAGFSGIKVAAGAREFGACWPEPWSLPIVARKGAARE